MLGGIHDKKIEDREQSVEEHHKKKHAQKRSPYPINTERTGC